MLQKLQIKYQIDQQDKLYNLGDFHFVGILGESGSNESMTEPESILPALQAGADSEAGSGDTAHMEPHAST